MLRFWNNEALTPTLSRRERELGAHTSVARSRETLREAEWRDDLFKTGIRGGAGRQIGQLPVLRTPLLGCRLVGRFTDWRPVVQPDATRLIDEIDLELPLIGFYDAAGARAFEPLVAPVSRREVPLFAFYRRWPGKYLKGLTFYVNPDQLSALSLGAHYHAAPSDPPPVIAPHSAGCTQMLVRFDDLAVPQAIIGATDIAMRQFLDPDLLAFTVTRTMSERLCALVDRSFLRKPFLESRIKALRVAGSWRRLTERPGAPLLVPSTDE